jgi:hypothetical protein
MKPSSLSLKLEEIEDKFGDFKHKTFIFDFL